MREKVFGEESKESLFKGRERHKGSNVMEQPRRMSSVRH